LQTGLASFVLFSPERQSTPGAVAASFAILLLPYSLLGPFVGVFIDRWSRRQTLVLANVVRAALAIGVAAVLAASVSGWRLGLAALVIIAVNRFVLTALSAALPSTVPGHQLVTANAFAPTLGTFALVVGGGLAAVHYGGASAETVFSIIAAANVVSCLVLMALFRRAVG
jgi:MFS family permease